MSVSSSVLVTGAGGFIGRHLIRELAGTEAEPIVATTRDGRDGTRRLDMLDPATMPAALAGIDAVVHCAVGNQHVTVDGTRALLQAATAAGVRRFVHFSTISVYAATEGVITEGSERVSPSGHGYGAFKSAAEDICLAAKGIQVVRLRPSIVYGPGGHQWVTHYAQRIRSGRWGTLGTAGDGLCNLVHVSDVAAAVAAAIHAPAASGGAFNVNGPEALTWNDWFSRIAKAIGAPPLRPISALTMKARTLTVLPHKVLNKLGIRVTDHWMLGAPTRSELALYAAKVSYPLNAASTGLGWQPRIGVDDGLKSCLPGLREEGLA